MTRLRPVKRRVIWHLLAALTLSACAGAPLVSPTGVLPTDVAVPSLSPAETATQQPASPSSAATTPHAATPPPPELLTGPATVAVEQLRVRTGPSVGSPQVSFPYADNSVVVDVQLELSAGMPVWMLDEAPVVAAGLRWRQIAVNNVLYNDGSVLVGWGPEPRWLLCTNIHYAHVNVTADTAWAFPVYAAEGPETMLGDRGRWLLLSGHFDDPAALECAGAEDEDQTADQLELFCRTRFVLESVTPHSGP